MRVVAAVARLYAARPTVSRAVRPPRLHAPSYVTINANQTAEIPQTGPFHRFSTYPRQCVAACACASGLFVPTRSIRGVRRVFGREYAGFASRTKSQVHRYRRFSCPAHVYAFTCGMERVS